MKNIRKITAFMLAFAAIALSACGNDGKEAVTETSPETVTASEETTVTEPEETTAESTETTVNESPESETEETTIDVAYEFFHQITPNNVTSPEVIKGAPDVCDVDAIMASRRDDMMKYAEPIVLDSVYDEETETTEFTYGNAIEYAESYFGYSFNNASPVISYVKDDFDLDGKDEYYLCMVEQEA